MTATHIWAFIAGAFCGAGFTGLLMVLTYREPPLDREE